MFMQTRLKGIETNPKRHPFLAQFPKQGVGKSDSVV